MVESVEVFSYLKFLKERLKSFKTIIFKIALKHIALNYGLHHECRTPQNHDACSISLNGMKFFVKFKLKPPEYNIRVIVVVLFLLLGWNLNNLNVTEIYPGFRDSQLQ